MKYFKQIRDCEPVNKKEITAEEARDLLSAWWKKDYIEKLIDDEIAFRLYTPFSEIWTQTDAGLVPQPGFYGAVDIGMIDGEEN